MTDSDSDLPDLVESSDDETFDGTQLTAAKLAEKWLQRKRNFLERQELWNRVFCLGPFLFGVNNIIAASWIKALSNSKLMLKEERQFQINFLDWQEWDSVDLIDLAIEEVHKNLRNKDTLSTVIDLVYRLEHCKTGLVIDVDLAIQEAEKVTQITNIWRPILSHELSKGKEKAAKFAVLYIVKIYQEHVLKHDSRLDFIDQTKLNVEQKKDKATTFKEKGNELFKLKEYEKSETFYTNAAKLDPFCHVYYGNRAQTYHHLGRYMDALADGRRAITIKPDFPKGHFRYAKAFHELGRLDTAIRVIKEGLALCQAAVPGDVKNINQLKEHLQQYQNEKKSIKHLNPLPKNLNDKLSTLITDDGDIDLTDKLDIRVPPRKKLTGELALYNEPDRDSSDEKSRPSNREQEKKKRKKKEEETRKRKQSEEEKRKKVEQAELELEEKRRQEEEKHEFESYLKQGWEAVNIDMPKNAMLNYRKALEMVTSEEKKKLYGIDDIDVVTLKYAFGISAIKTGIYKNINDGMETFQDIINNHQEVRFPLAYFGLGKAYITLFRFSDALEPLDCGKRIAKNINYVQVTWPGTTNKIPENDSRELLSQIKDLIQICKTPPVPDALCRHHTDETDTRTAIYVNDPGFKGSVKIVCQMNCVIPFHMTCWKTYKTSLHKAGDKDVLDTVCPTPDCTGFVVKMEVTRHDTITKDYVSSKYTAIKEANKGKKPAVKQKTSSDTKVVKKQEKKENRKHKKKQKQEETVETEENDNEDSGVVITDGASASAFVEEILLETQPLPSLKDTTVLKKDEDDFQKITSKGKRNRKKKDKAKQILNVEVNFSDRKEDSLLNENSVFSDEESNRSKSQTPFSVPSELQSQISNFEKNYQGHTKPLFQPDEITENLFSYFSDILQANGPLAVDDVKVQQELEVFPPEALDRVKQVGGLCDFLKQSLKFAVIDDVISLLSDAKRAREIALLRRSEREKNSVPVIVPVNAWTTVGKSTNNVDSLKESILNTQNSAGISQMSGVRPGLPSQTPGLVSSSSSNSLVSQGSDSANLAQNMKPSLNGFNEPSRIKEIRKNSNMDNLDSIDDFPTLTSSVGKKKMTETINDLDAISDPDSDTGIVYPRPGPIKPPFDDKLDVNLSRTSSHSDISEKSSRSDFSTDMKPKPLRPLGVEKIGLGKKMGSSGTNWDKLESDFDSSWNKVKKEEFERVTESPRFGSVGLELKQAAEDFVRKSDEKFVSELAESVVEKLYQGKYVSDTERQNTLNKVSSDIWKDFEKSANAGKLRGPGLWADTPAGQDYSNNLGKFATDFMKKHYEKTDGNSPTSNLSSPFPPALSSTESGLGSFSSSWKASPIESSIKTNFNSPFSVSSSGYDLFSGPSWGIDAFNSKTSPSPTGQQLIRPPNLTSGYYQRNPAPLNSSPGIFPPPNFTPPAFPNIRMPPPLNVFQSMKIDKKEVEIQVEPVTNTVSVMTDPYEPYKVEYLKLKNDMKEVLKLMEESKSAYEILVQDLNKKEKTIKDLEARIANKEGVHDFDRKNWVNEKKAYGDKIRDLQQQLDNKEKMVKDLNEKIQSQEKKVNDQRTKDSGEIKKLSDKAQKSQKEAEFQTRRAANSEVELIKMKLSTAKGFLERSQMEATYHSQHLSAQVSKLKEDSKSIPSALQQTLDYWKSVLQKSEENLDKLKSDTEAQINEVKNGKKLSELTPVVVDNPPQMPETVKVFMMGAAGQMVMQRSSQSRPSGVGAAGNGPLPAPPTSKSPLPSSPVPQGPPKPITPIHAAPGLIPPRPLSALRSPLSLTNKPPPLRPLGVKQPMTSFEKLMYKLNTSFPNHTKQEFDTLIQQLRQEKGGSLSGMTMEDIVSKIGEKIGKRKQSTIQNHVPMPKPLAPPPGINKSWAFTASCLSDPIGAGARKIETFQEEEDPCVICHEEMTSQPSVTLECNHTFHDECIRKWFQEQSTCPNCRVHTLLSDEFPSLA